MKKDFETKIPRLSENEGIILGLLISEGEMYGLEIVTASGGKLKRGTVYVTLNRMEEKGFVSSDRILNPRDPASGLPRRIYKPTGHGRRVFDTWRAAASMWRSQTDPSFAFGTNSRVP